MGSRRQTQALEAARRREQQGDLDVAASLYLTAGAPQQTARIFANQGRYGEAGRVLLKCLGVEPSKVGNLELADRKLARLAASYLSKAGDFRVAVEILVALDELASAAELLERSGDLIGAQRLRGGRHPNTSGTHEAAQPAEEQQPTAGFVQRIRDLLEQNQVDLAVKLCVDQGDYDLAGRVYSQQGLHAQAGQLFAEAGSSYEAAVSFLHAGNEDRAFEQLLAVPRDSDRYRNAAVQVVRLIIKGKPLDFQSEHFLTDFIRVGPTTDAEREAFYRLSKVYEKNDLLENAKESLRKIVERGGYRDAAEQLQRLEGDNRLDPLRHQRISREESHFHGDSTSGSAAASLKAGGRMKLAQLGDLPPLRDPSLQREAMTKPQQPAGAPLVTLPPSQSIPLTPVAPPEAVPGKEDTLPSKPSPFGPPSISLEGAQPEVTAEPTRLPPSLAGDAMSTFVVGSTIADRYRLDAKIGQGGMAMVFRAFDMELDDTIAIKVFLQQTHDPKMQAESLSRFKQELKLSRQLTHPNIIRLYDIGLHHGHRYISMELLVGETLDDLMGDEPIDFALGLGCLVQACVGLQAAHDKGVIHRDIKPENMFLTEDEVIKILDFGIAKNTTVTSKTIAGMIAGTPEYMAPEQISDFSSVCAGTDLYALGVVAYRMFTGSVPFVCDDIMKLLMKHVNDEPPPPRSFNPEIPEELEAIILKLLQKDPADRYGSCNELASSLQRVRRHFRRE